MNTISEMMKSGRITSIILVLALCGCAGRSSRHSSQETTGRKKVAQKAAMQENMSVELDADALMQLLAGMEIPEIAGMENQEIAQERSTGDDALGVCVFNCPEDSDGSGGGSSSWSGSGSSSGGAAGTSVSSSRARERKRRARERSRLAERDKKREKASQRRKESQPKPPLSRDLWAIKPFYSKPGWITGPAAELLEDRRWGARLAEAIKRRLEGRAQRAKVVPKEMTDAEMEKLDRQGLRYMIGGKLLSAKDSPEESGESTLEVRYHLRRKTDSGLKVVQVRRIRVSIPSPGGLGEAVLRKLIDAAAGKIASHVMTDIPADLLAQRG